MKQLTQLAALATAAALAAGCSDAGSSGDPLNQAEVEALAEAIGQMATEGAFAAGGTGPIQAPPVTITQTLTTTTSCEGSGNVLHTGSWTATINTDDNTGDITFDYTSTPNNCRVTTESGKIVTVSGKPNIKVTGDWTFSQTSVEGTLAYEGGVSWLLDPDREGTCTIDFDITFNFTETDTAVTGTAAMSGTVCGTTITRTVSISD